MDWKLSSILLTAASIILSYRQQLEAMNKPVGYVLIAIALGMNIAVPYLIEKGVIIRLGKK